MNIERTIVRREEPLEYDERPHRTRLGLIALSTDFTVEPDFIAMRPSDEIAVYVARIAFHNPLTQENLRAMEPRLGAAAALLLPDETIDAVAFACTSASALLGDPAVAAAVATGKPDSPVVTPISGAQAALRALNVGRVSLLSPYPKDLSEGLADGFAAGGAQVCSVTYLDINDDRRIARLSHESIIAAAEAALAPEAEALFISCTGLRAVAVIEELEARLGVPVLSSNQALFWATMRAAGESESVEGFGQLLKNC